MEPAVRCFHRQYLAAAFCKNVPPTSDKSLTKRPAEGLVKSATIEGEHMNRREPWKARGLEEPLHPPPPRHHGHVPPHVVIADGIEAVSAQLAEIQETLDDMRADNGSGKR